MPKLAKEDTYEVPEQILKQGISDVRQKFFEGFNKEQEQFDLEFVEKIRVDDDLLGRFVWDNNGKADKALDQLKATAKWRKDFGIKDLKVSGFNQELLRASILYPNKCDHNGHPIMMLVVNRVIRDSKTNSDKQKILVFWIEKILKKSKDHKITIFLDCSDVGIQNMDLETMVFLTQNLMLHYPNSLGYVLVYNMPWLFNVIWQVIKAILPKHYRPKVKFVNKETVREFVKPENLPERMGGQVSDYYDYDKLEDYEEEK